ncbi:MAG: hypothetical protein IPP56_09660 [Bacteroidetes bacterium]|nr:hypothetical protein [Bacteroidota bacterium]MBK9672332.1 hypothetical protein [Bacteroidota bacterium]MBK9799954.1 hypothetical protein [Bacteroidota bacterium]
MIDLKKQFRVSLKSARSLDFKLIEEAMKMVDLDIKVSKEAEDEITIDFKSEQDKKKFKMIIVAAGYKGQFID